MIEKLFLVGAGLMLFLLVGYIISDFAIAFVNDITSESNIKDNGPSYQIRTYIISPSEPKGFSVKVRDEETRKNNIKMQLIDEEVDTCIKKITKNWKRVDTKNSYEAVYDEDGKLIEENVYSEDSGGYFGYDEEEDSDLRWELKQRALNGEKIC